MTTFNYVPYIKEALVSDRYFRRFSRFTMRRRPDCLCIETDGKSHQFPLTVNAEALNRRLQGTEGWPDALLP